MTNVIEVGTQDFEQRVLEASKERPVVVDFWAAWCQPCLILGPVLERLAAEYDGAFTLAKVDVDANPVLASTFGIQGIPAVKAFRDGAVVGEFVGVQPEEAIRGLIDGLVPREDPLASAASEALELIAQGKLEAARATLASLPRSGPLLPVAAELDLRAMAADADEVGRAAGDALGGDRRGALERLLKLVADGDAAERARGCMVAIFHLIGEEDPLSLEYRRRLASILF